MWNVEFNTLNHFLICPRFGVRFYLMWNVKFNIWMIFCVLIPMIWGILAQFVWVASVPQIFQNKYN